MEEYEYSFKVTDINPYIKYCENNNFEKLEESSQIRILYRNINKIMARITTTEKNGNKRVVLDFKDDNQSNDRLKVSKETLPLDINDDNSEAIDSILDMLEYKKDKTLIRKRIVYCKDGVTFELDSYSSPQAMFVVGIEGEKTKVDLVYNELNKQINYIF